MVRDAFAHPESGKVGRAFGFLGSSELADRFLAAYEPADSHAILRSPAAVLGCASLTSLLMLINRYLNTASRILSISPRLF